jgi:glycosyltransferase involved in cell wall biosynthesis
VAVIRRPANPLSLAVFEAALAPHWANEGITLLPCDENGPLPPSDLLWEPGAGWRLTAPVVRKAWQTRHPLLVTLHGLRPFVLPSPQDGPQADLVRQTLLADWQHLRHHAHVVSPSAFGAQEVQTIYGVPAEHLHIIPHGVDTALFHPPGLLQRLRPSRPALLHIATWQPVKNTDRVFAAYASLPSPKPALLAIVPGYPAADAPPPPPGVQLSTAARPAAELAALYRQALAFIAPSLRETFGMPLLEAMASGCPVLTANTSACAEVGQGAALLVDPADTQAIAQGLHTLITQATLRRRLSRSGLHRARAYPWAASAQTYAALMRCIARPERC